MRNNVGLTQGNKEKEDWKKKVVESELRNATLAGAWQYITLRLIVCHIQVEIRSDVNVYRDAAACSNVKHVSTLSPV